jgi:predicted glycogen debranching enzyme
MILFNREICANPEEAKQREWLETNGLGGFASSTIIGLNTRRYHSLLTAAIKPPVFRMALLSKFEETVIVDGIRYDLSANQYPGVVHPKGYVYLESFKLDPHPVFEYKIDGLTIIKTLIMVHGENTTIIGYTIKNLPEDSECSLELRPLLASRDYHSLMHENDAVNSSYEISEGMVSTRLYLDAPAAPILHLAHNASSVEPAGFWYRNFEYEIEMERGLDYREDLFNPFLLRFILENESEASVIASTIPHRINEIESLRNNEILRRKTISAPAGAKNEFVQQLLAAADQFIVARNDQKTVIAGYPWFADWGRDTLIALPGLTLATKRPEIAKSILLEFKRHIDRGMIPNRFPDGGEEPEYNTVDATLWFFETIRALLHATGDIDFIKQNFYDSLIDILNWHERGTRYQIKIDQDGLLHSGENGVQLTWMDAKVGENVITPRTGKPVEIQALWYNALKISESLASEFKDQSTLTKVRDLAALASDSFNLKFWNSEADCLFDVIDDEYKDASIRPNQIFAISLPHSMIDAEKAKKIINTVENHLLTPVGLRTLSPFDPHYKGLYQGDQASRDSAYHQGTVWPWLLGPFITARFKTYGFSQENRIRAREIIGAFRDHLMTAGLGQISEVFDGDPPHSAGGCIAQAWSVAELLRVITQFNLE